jgi:hypothetical protein
MSSPIQPAKDKDRDSLLMYAPSRKRKKPPVVAPSIEQPPQGRVVHAGGPTFSGLAGEDLRLRHERSLTPKIVAEPKFLKGDRPALSLIALRLSGAIALAALIALVVVSLPANQTSLLPNMDVQQDQPPTATAQPSLNEPSTHANEPWPNSGSEERQLGIATVMAAPVTLPNPTDVQQQRDQSPTAAALSQPDDVEIAALIKRGQDFVRNRDFSSARLLLKRAAEAGSAAALSLGETFDPLVLQQFGEIGVQPDLAQARDWYERAARLGSDAASQRLAKIAPPPQ